MNREKSGRKQDGRFAPGVSGNRAGKPRGTRHKITMAIESLLDGQADQLTQKCISMALEGDTVAMRLCLERLAPPRREWPLKIDLPQVSKTEDIPEAITALLQAVGSGAITVSECEKLSGILGRLVNVFELAELEKRISALELETGDAE